MKILQVTGSLYPYSYGGIGIVVDQISEALTQIGMDVEVLYIGSNDYIKNKKSYTTINIKRDVTICGNPISSKAILWLLKRRYNYNIIHAHSHLFFSTFICALLRRIGSSPLIITNHGLYSQTAPMAFSTIWLKTLGKFIFNSADNVICLSEHDKRALMDLGIDELKITLIPNWINTTKFFPDPSRTIKNRILFVGRLVPGKGIHFLIEAFRDIIKEISSAKLIIVGNGPEEDKLKQMTDNYSLNRAIEFKKNLSYTQLIEEYHKCALFVLPSFSEGFPLTVLEAMACGKPIIAAADIHEVLCDVGLIVPFGSPKGLESAIISLLMNDQALIRIAELSRRYVEEKYTWEKVERDINKIYMNLSK